MAHPVAELITERARSGSRPGHRDDGARVALVVEGGGMRGAITGGMAVQLEALGLRDAFDDVYGASAGTLNGAWFVGGAAARGLPAWADPVLRTATIRKRNLLRGRPLVDGRHLTEVVYERDTPMPFADVLGSPVRLRPVATDVATGAATDLAPLVHDVATLKLALRASTALPVLSGGPVALGGRRFYDAGVAAAVPHELAVAAGATHLLVLRSRRLDERETGEQGRTGALVARLLARHSAELAAAFLDRPARLRRDDEQLLAAETDPAARPAVLSLRPPPGTPTVGRLERDHGTVLAGLEAGRAAVRDVLG